jgi:ABC-2 type transport system permease protein
MVNAFRYGILGTSDISISHAYAILVVFVVVLFSGCMTLMNRGIGIRE